MAWSMVELARGENVVVYDITSSAAGDIELVITHGLKWVPMWINLMPHNSLAQGALYWVDNIDATVIHLHKPNGGAGSVVHLGLWTLRLTLPWAPNFVRMEDIP